MRGTPLAPTVQPAEQRQALARRRHAPSVDRRRPRRSQKGFRRVKAHRDLPELTAAVRRELNPSPTEEAAAARAPDTLTRSGPPPKIYSGRDILQELGALRSGAACAVPCRSRRRWARGLAGRWARAWRSGPVSRSPGGAVTPVRRHWAAQPVFVWGRSTEKSCGAAASACSTGPPRTLASGCVRYSNEITTPKLAPPPRSAQKRSGSVPSLAMTTSLDASTTSAGSKLSTAIPNLPISQAIPPPSVRPRRAIAEQPSLL